LLDPRSQETNPNKEAMVMGTNGHTIKGHEWVAPHLNREAVKEWAKRAFTKERIADVAVCASTVSVLGFVLFVLHRAMENSHTIVGF
jgi:hypothetical protein